MCQFFRTVININQLKTRYSNNTLLFQSDINNSVAMTTGIVVIIM